MAVSQTQVFRQFPWIGGLNTTQDPSVIPSNQLVTANNLIFGIRGSRKKRDGINFNWDSNTYISSKTVSSVDTGTEIITMTATHGYVAGQCVFYSTTGTAIAGLTNNSWYYVVSPSGATLQLSNVRGGAAINLTSSGTGTHTLSRDIDIICGTEYTYGTSTKSTLLVTLAEDGSIYSYTSGGTRSTVEQFLTATSSAGLVTEGSDDINYTDHGFATGDEVYYVASGASTAIGGLTSGTLYYAIRTNANAFQLSATVGGAAIDLTDDGVGTHHFGATQRTGTTGLTISSMCVINNKLIICSNGGLPVKKWTNGTGLVKNLGGYPVKSKYCRVHLGRLWLLDPDRLDRLHYSTTGNPEEWNGVGDSGAIDVGTQDGDKDGITGFFSFKSDMFVLKRTKLYRIRGAYPEEFTVELISNGIGCVSFNSIVYIDQDDVFWMSEKGIHSLAATSNFGDFQGKYISKDIQGSFNDDFAKATLNKSFGVYLPTINSVAYALTESDTSVNNDIWLYNIPLDSWYRWDGISCNCIFTANDSDQVRVYLGTVYERLGKAFAGVVYDTTIAAANTPINFDCKTGTIYPDSSPHDRKGFKRFSLIYKKTQIHEVTATITVDNYHGQALSFSDDDSGDLLGSTFVLNTSHLGFEGVLAPYTYTIDGWGRGFSVRIQQSGTNQDIEIQGFAIEWEPGDLLQEVIE